MRRASWFVLGAALVFVSAPDLSWAAGLAGGGVGASRGFGAGPGLSRGMRSGGRSGLSAVRGQGGSFRSHGRGFGRGYGYGGYGYYGPYGWGGLGWGGGPDLNDAVAQPVNGPGWGVVAATGIRPSPVGQPVVYVLYSRRDAVAQWRASRVRRAQTTGRAGRGAWSDPPDASGPEWGGSGARVIHLRVARGV